MGKKNQHVKLVGFLFFLALLMFGFGFALVPIYNKMCQALGINGKTSMLAEAYNEKRAKIDTSRTITVQFMATQRPSLPWAFYPEIKEVKIHPGSVAKLSYYAENTTENEMTVQAIPSVTPGIAAKHIKKTECFCFAKQTLGAHEAMHMPLLFHVDVDLPQNIRTLTLSYTLFDVTGKGHSR
ncbi:MAG: cytochrome c oxidase assembly protein [Legionellales bacterium RIFCSPHIGHO2_12_FULL_37_14]|nr:MAG: cytochrome c oxidase assembly protein [Legionellales bacterium RIFCSPHIGHO2_12_FULL_37_14]